MTRLAAILSILLLASPKLSADVAAFLGGLGDLAREAEASSQSVVVGEDGWLYFAPELRHLSVGEFWGDAAKNVSRANPAYADPLPAILDFKRQLDNARIELLVVPVPAKAAVLPEPLARRVGVDLPADARIDRADAEFLRVLAEAGVWILDLAPSFRKHVEDARPIYCRQDTHWSGAGIEIAAHAIAEALAAKPGLTASTPRREFESRTIGVEIAGDLWTALGDAQLPKEHVQVTQALERGRTVVPWRESPVLLLGDSHTLVFHGGDMLATGAGLADHLALRLGFPVDLVGVRGSGATPSRLNLMRRRDNLAGKRVVVWVFTVREYTEGQGWRLVPVIRDVP
ncbi:hypothetical protein FJZ36_12235 [Candidatus Poribacteria bacterium]|nr:hypothetical protein [Candidatus Poribacteria bacterium]